MESSTNRVAIAAIGGGGLLGGLAFAVTAALGHEAVPETGEFANRVAQTGCYAALLAVLGTWMGEWHLSKGHSLRYVVILDTAIFLIIAGAGLYGGDLATGMAQATGCCCGSVVVFLAGRRDKRAAGSDNGTDGSEKALGDG
ncbi:hypothetical protein [Spirillospora sp. CA-128828]|uniref:hypothetical protein n=1 Tax=Spirillospora sp. CA-128828 TaxID=3240033 RepID=UPI003D93A9AB